MRMYKVISGFLKVDKKKKKKRKQNKYHILIIANNK